LDWLSTNSDVKRGTKYASSIDFPVNTFCWPLSCSHRIVFEKLVNSQIGIWSAERRCARSVGTCLDEMRSRNPIRIFRGRKASASIIGGSLCISAPTVALDRKSWTSWHVSPKASHAQRRRSQGRAQRTRRRCPLWPTLRTQVVHLPEVREGPQKLSSAALLHLRRQAV
jgi:hypothetical protein